MSPISAECWICFRWTPCLFSRINHGLWFLLQHLRIFVPAHTCMIYYQREYTEMRQIALYFIFSHPFCTMVSAAELDFIVWN